MKIFHETSVADSISGEIRGEASSSKYVFNKLS